MEFLGSELGTLARVVVAILIVIGLIALTIWLIRRFGPVTLSKSGVARGRQPRLALLESAAIDARRRLVLIRRDNVEHLLLVGGPTDVVVEPNIVRAATMQTQPTPMPGAAREPIARAAGRPATLEPLDEHEAPLVPPSSPDTQVPTPAPAAELPVSPPPAPEPRHPPAPTPRVDPQYAEMAQRLEAALRRPPEARPAPPPTVAHPSAAPARIEPTPPPMPRAPEPKPTPSAAAPPAKAPEPRISKPNVPPPAATVPVPPPPKATLKRDVFDNLEEEMANLLGRGDKKAN